MLHNNPEIVRRFNILIIQIPFSGEHKLHSLKQTFIRAKAPEKLMVVGRRLFFLWGFVPFSGVFAIDFREGMGACFTTRVRPIGNHFSPSFTWW